MFKKPSLPTVITLFRVALIPVFMIIYYIPDSLLSLSNKDWVASSIFLIAGLSDYFDGYLARKWNVESQFGAFLDPVADKALVAASLIILVDLHRTFMFAAIIIIMREIAVSALREWMAKVGDSGKTSVAFIGKLKTASQMLAIGFLLLNKHTLLLGNSLMLIAVLLTIVSMVYYLEQSKHVFSK